MFNKHGEILPHKLPTAEQYNLSNELKLDNYKLPRMVQVFIDRANQELPKGFVMVPWTQNQAVTLLHGVQPMSHFTYDAIDQDVVFCLNQLPKLIDSYWKSEGEKYVT